jgi:hypothetical protein
MLNVGGTRMVDLDLLYEKGNCDFGWDISGAFWSTDSV